MNKKEAIEHIRKKLGFCPYIGLFDLYDDEQDIPQSFIDMMSQPIQRPNNNYIITGAEGAKFFNDALEHLDKVKKDK